MRVLAIFCLALVASVCCRADEKEVVAELNLARTQPQKYAKLVEEFRRRFNDKDKRIYVNSAGQRIKTKEGLPAVDEAIALLRKQEPVPELTLSKGLSLAALDHVKDIGPAGITGHDGTDKSKPAQRMARHGKVNRMSGENISFGPSKARDIVMQLIIDDGVPNRGHRANIYKREFKTVGIAIGPHKTYRTMCVMDFADAFKDK